MASVIRTITVGTSPYVSISNGTYTWVTNNGSGTVSKIQNSTGTLVATITVGTNPAGITVDDYYVWVANNGSNTVTQIDVSTNAIINTITGFNYPTGISSDGTYVWVTNPFLQNVIRLNASTGVIVDTLNGSGNFNYPTVINSTGPYVWVSNNGFNNGTTVTKLNASTGAFISNITVGTQPRGLEVGSSYVWVANYNNSNGNTVTKIKISDSSTTTITVGSVGIGSSAVTIDGLYAWVSNKTANTVTQINVSTNAIISTISGFNSPEGLYSDGTYVWVPNNAVGGGLSQIQIFPTICYAKGTKILCESGYVAIEDIKKGDLVKTYRDGYREVDVIGHSTMINNPEKWSECMYKLESTNPEFEDLIVTGGHGILKKQLSLKEIEADSDWFKRPRFSQIDGMYLQRAAFCKDFIKIETQDDYEYYHFSLKSNIKWKRYGVWANGILSESTFTHNLLSSLKLE